MDCISLYQEHRQRGNRPALLESLGFLRPSATNTFLGTQCVSCLEVLNGRLYRDGHFVGPAMSIFDQLILKKTNRFFPAWIGFFSYEFAQNFDMPTRTDDDFPQAVFFLYDEGYCWSNRQVVEQANSTSIHQNKVELLNQFSERDFLCATREIQNQIKRGDVYQVNLSQQLYFDASDIDPLNVYLALRRRNPSPFMGILEGKDWSIVSGSPERLFRYHDGVISTRPIAGTRPRDADPKELLANVKERAEHAMLVDLLRNDLAKVSEPGSTCVNEAMTIEEYSHVIHLVSEIQSKSNAPLVDVFKSIFPGGTITGAPKVSAMQSIAELEPVPRGPYTGSMGYVSSGFGVDFNILIRSLVTHQNTGYVSAGAGIVQGSDPEREYAETQQKAKSVREVLGG